MRGRVRGRVGGRNGGMKRGWGNRRRRKGRRKVWRDGERDERERKRWTIGEKSAVYLVHPDAANDDIVYSDHHFAPGVVALGPMKHKVT